MHNKGNKDTKSSKWQTEQHIKASPRNLAPVLQNIADQGEEEASNFHLVWYVKGVLPVYQKKTQTFTSEAFRHIVEHLAYTTKTHHTPSTARPPQHSWLIGYLAPHKFQQEEKFTRGPELTKQRNKTSIRFAPYLRGKFGWRVEPARTAVCSVSTSAAVIACLCSPAGRRRLRLLPAAVSSLPNSRRRFTVVA